MNKLISIALVSLGTVYGLSAAAAETVHANLESKNDSKVIGTAEFTELPSGLQIEYKIMGLKPDGTYGFHIHEKGDCSSKDAKSAGSHYHKIADTGGTSLDTPGAFAGDLPSLKTDKKGIAQGRLLVANLSLQGVNPVSGRAIMVHGGPDDVTKPSAPRVACGVINPPKVKTK